MSKTEFDKRKAKDLWIYCNECQRDTSHNILTGVDYSDGNDEVNFWVGCDVVQCGGCKNITFTMRSTDSESYYEGDKDVIEQFPPKEDRSKYYIKNDVYKLPLLLSNIYKETLKAIGNKSFTLAGIGLRAIVETLCQDKAIKGNNLEKKIDNLITEGFLTSDGAEILHGIRLIGNDAAHAAKAPKKEQIDAAMKVVDHLILGIYIIPEEASDTLPKRANNITPETTSNANMETTSAKE
jgi:hypothetical protein